MPPSISAFSTPSWSGSASPPSRRRARWTRWRWRGANIPAPPASLDALCKRFGIDRSAREKHGALLDAALLTEVYLELIGGRQPALGLQRTAAAAPDAAGTPRVARARTPRPHAASEAEAAAHAAFVATLKDPIWND